MLIRIIKPALSALVQIIVLVAAVVWILDSGAQTMGYSWQWERAKSLEQLEQKQDFIRRHIGPSPAQVALSMVVLLVTVYTRRPLDFAAFPTVL